MYLLWICTALKRSPTVYLTSKRLNGFLKKYIPIYVFTFHIKKNIIHSSSAVRKKFN